METVSICEPSKVVGVIPKNATDVPDLKASIKINREVFGKRPTLKVHGNRAKPTTTLRRKVWDMLGSIEPRSKGTYVPICRTERNRVCTLVVYGD